VSAFPGLYFIGLPWLHTWGSGRFAGVARNAAHIAEHIFADTVQAEQRSAAG
jgi:putative flavoprotein involved in K+ transport